ncbi:MAG: hypothetical protein ABIG32_00925 [Candidatus Uhrbacteria bacterium]|nr:hypothetical protein [Patescibacteria group bacterium]
MPRKSVPEFVSGMTKGQEILLALWQAVEDVGGGEEDLLRLRQDPDRAQDVAKLLVGWAEMQLLHPNKVAESAPNPNIRMRAVVQVFDQEVLFNIATHDESRLVRDVARAGITDEDVLYNVIIMGYNGLQGRHADDMKRLKNGRHLAWIALTHQFQEVQLAAVDRLHELGLQKHLADVVIAEAPNPHMLNSVVLDSAQAKVMNPHQITRILVCCRDTNRILKAADSLTRHPEILTQALIDRELPVETATDLDWFYDRLVGFVELTEGELKDNLRRVALKAKSVHIARHALGRRRSKGSCIRFEPSTEKELAAWRAEQAEVK